MRLQGTSHLFACRVEESHNTQAVDEAGAVQLSLVRASAAVKMQPVVLNCTVNFVEIALSNNLANPHLLKPYPDAPKL